MRDNCEAGDKCRWNGKSQGCTQPGCFGPAIFRSLAKRGIHRATCKHEYGLMYSTFGADQGAMCRKCHKEASLEVYKKLKREELEAQLRRLNKL